MDPNRTDTGKGERELKTCKVCEAETYDEIIEAHDGYCDDCILETMEPEWVKEHYPDAYGEEEEEEE